VLVRSTLAWSAEWGQKRKCSEKIRKKKTIVERQEGMHVGGIKLIRGTEVARYSLRMKKKGQTNRGVLKRTKKPVFHLFNAVNMGGVGPIRV